MTEKRLPGTGPDEVERRDYAALIDSLTNTLNLHGGLTEAIDTAGYTAMSSHIADLFNLEAGLQSALAAHHDTGQPLELGATTSVADLLPRLGARDPAALGEIVRRYGDLVFATVRSFRLKEADVLGVVQMTWFRLVENSHRIQRPEQLGGWLATTARRECLHVLRRQTQQPPPTPHHAESGVRQEAPSVGSEQRGAVGSTRARALKQLRELLGKKPTEAVAASETSKSDLPIAMDVLDPEVVVLPLSDIAQRLGLPVTRIHQMLRDGQLLGIRRNGIAVVPAEFISGNAVVKGLPGTITLLRDAGYSAEEILRWLFTAEDSLPGTPISALRSDRGHEVKRQAMTK